MDRGMGKKVAVAHMGYLHHEIIAVLCKKVLKRWASEYTNHCCPVLCGGRRLPSWRHHIQDFILLLQQLQPQNIQTLFCVSEEARLVLFSLFGSCCHILMQRCLWCRHAPQLCTVLTALSLACKPTPVTRASFWASKQTKRIWRFPKMVSRSQTASPGAMIWGLWGHRCWASLSWLPCHMPIQNRPFLKSVVHVWSWNPCSANL